MPGEASRARGGMHCGRAWGRSALGPSPRRTGSTGLGHRLQTSFPPVPSACQGSDAPWASPLAAMPTSATGPHLRFQHYRPAWPSPKASCRAKLLQAGRCQAGRAAPQAETIEIGIGRRVRDAGGPGISTLMDSPTLPIRTATGG